MEEGITIAKVPDSMTLKPEMMRHLIREHEKLGRTLTEEETMFRAAVREFAEAEVKPLVHEMDEAARFEPSLIPRFFELGLMGIGVPEQYWGAGGSIFMATLAIEELLRLFTKAVRAHQLYRSP